MLQNYPAILEVWKWKVSRRFSSDSLCVCVLTEEHYLIFHIIQTIGTRRGWGVEEEKKGGGVTSEWLLERFKLIAMVLPLSYIHVL